MSWMLYVIAMFFGIWSNRYFGHHWYPQTDAELVCGGIGLILCAMAVIATLIERNSKVKR